MKISIVLPVYNQERFLRDALESVGAQTYSDIEIVVVNDGSTDSSLRIATEYAILGSRLLARITEASWRLTLLG